MIKKKVAIISYGNCPNLGDRIGQYIIFNMLPYNCEVKFLYLPPFWKDKYKNDIYDLAIIGTGHSVFHKTLEDESFLKFLKNQKKNYRRFWFAISRSFRHKKISCFYKFILSYLCEK